MTGVSVGGNGNAHKCKTVVCHFPKPSIKHIRLMQFRTQVGLLWVVFTARGDRGGAKDFYAV